MTEPGDPFDDLFQPERSLVREETYQATPGQTDRHHPCCEPGCQEWGAYGWGTQNLVTALWFCGAHLPSWYWTRRA